MAGEVKPTLAAARRAIRIGARDARTSSAVGMAEFKNTELLGFYQLGWEGERNRRIVLALRGVLGMITRG